MQRDILRAGVWMAEYIDEEKRWVLIEGLEQLKLQAAIALADALRRSGLVRHKCALQGTFRHQGMALQSAPRGSRFP